MGTKKRLKKLEAAVRALPKEKWLIDRIVELSAEQTELRMRKQLRETTEHIVRQVVEEVGRMMPDESAVQRVVDKAVRKAVHEALRERDD